MRSGDLPLVGDEGEILGYFLGDTAMDDYETEHLRVDYLDRVFYGDEFLGYIDTDPWWPEFRLGPEPKWFLTELDELLDQWSDAQGNDTRPEAQAAFARANERLAR